MPNPKTPVAPKKVAASPESQAAEAPETLVPEVTADAVNEEAKEETAPPSSDETTAEESSEVETEDSQEEPEKIVEENEEEKEEAPIPAPKKQEDAVFNKRLSNALTENEKKGAELKRALQMQVEWVRENPEYIHRIASSDPGMANKVIQEVWGSRGIRSYKQLQDYVKLQELKDSDPSGYETKRELFEVKAKLEERERRERERVKKEFLKDKGIINNPYDPKFQRVEEALNLLNPKILEEDYEEALKLAFKISSGSVQSPQAPSEKPTMSVGAGKVATPGVQKTGERSEFTWLYDAWKKGQK